MIATKLLLVALWFSTVPIWVRIHNSLGIRIGFITNREAMAEAIRWDTDKCPYCNTIKRADQRCTMNQSRTRMIHTCLGGPQVQALKTYDLTKFRERVPFSAHFEQVTDVHLHNRLVGRIRQPLYFRSHLLERRYR